MITEFSSYIKEDKKFVNVPNLDKYYGALIDDEGSNIFVKEHQRRFFNKIYGRYVEFTSTWGQDIKGVVANVQFNIYGKDGRINRITCKIYLRNGENYNVKHRSRIKVISVKNKHKDIDPYGEEYWD